MTLQQQIRRNRLRSGIVVIGFVVLLGVVAGLIGAVLDLRLGVVALVGASLYALFAIISSRRMVARMTGAQEVGPDQLRPLRRLVENVSIAAGLPVTPDVRIVDDPSPNAFAAGIRPQTSYIGVTTGLLRVMPKRELEAVLGHEISHVRNRDTYLMTMATIFAGVIALIADVGFRMLVYGGGRSRRGGALVLVVAVVGLLLAPYAALLLRMSLSRRREFLADARIRGASQRSRGDGARAAQARARHDHDGVRRRIGRAPVGGEPDEPGRVRATRCPGALEPVRHSSAARATDRGTGGVGRIPPSGDASTRSAVRV